MPALLFLHLVLYLHQFSTLEYISAILVLFEAIFWSNFASQLRKFSAGTAPSNDAIWYEFSE